MKGTPHPGYSDLPRLAAWFNANTAKEGQLWMVGNGGLFLTDDEAVTLARMKADKLRQDEEARRHNHRILHPIDETQEGE